MKNENLSSRIVWADVVRLLAIFMVICAHCADPFNVSPQARLNPDFNFWGTIYGSLLRPCVPLFVMLTGMLILPVRMTTGAFYKKTAHAHSVAVSDCFGCLQPVSGTDGRRRTGIYAHRLAASARSPAHPGDGRARAVYGLGHCYGRLPQGAATGPTDFRITAKAVSSSSSTAP